VRECKCFRVSCGGHGRMRRGSIGRGFASDCSWKVWSLFVIRGRAVKHSGCTARGRVDRDALNSHRGCRGRSGWEKSGTGTVGPGRIRKNLVSVVIRSADLSGHWLVGYTGRQSLMPSALSPARYLIGEHRTTLQVAEYQAGFGMRYKQRCLGCS
jgi:hypothetical protein